ncbi:MAG: O-antigen ligase family protein [Anaerolineales bacterium]|nr:O-antigen ligase family protein [Anaerolineales bacterium]
MAALPGHAPDDLPPADNPAAPPADLAGFARFAAAFAARYADTVRFYQIWDEPNIAPHWGNRHVDPIAYAQMLRMAAAAIRAEDPDAQILTAALAPTGDRGHLAVDEVYFLQRMLAAGAKGSFDIVAIQPFGFGHSPLYLRQTIDTLNFQRAALLRRNLVAVGLEDVPIWAIRFGWNRDPSSPWSTVTPSDQARFATEALDLAWQAWPWLGAMGWAIDRPAAPASDPRWGFALKDQEGLISSVRTAISQWRGGHPDSERTTLAPPAPNWLPWLGIGVALALIAWRMIAAGRVAQLRLLLRDFGYLPWPIQGMAWLAMLVVYYFATWPPLIGLCWLIWAALCLAQPGAGLALTAALLPFYYQHKDWRLVNMVISIPPSLAALLALSPALISVTRRRAPRVTWLDGVVLLILPITLLSAGVIWHRVAYFNGLVELVFAPLLLWVAARVLVRTDVARRQVALALFGGGLIVAMWGLVDWAIGQGAHVDGMQRLVGPYYSPNHTALYLVRTVFLGMGLIWALAGSRRMLQAMATVTVLGALLLTGSRGAILLGLPVGATIFAWMALRRRPALWRWLRLRRRWLWWAAGLVAVGAGVLLVLSSGRMANTRSLLLRVDSWQTTFALLRTYWLTGIGPGEFQWFYPAFLPLTAVSAEPNLLHPHNVWLEMGVTWGVWGLLWLAVLLSIAWWESRTAPRQNAAMYWITTGLAAAFGAALMHAQTDAFFLLADLAGWNALAFALLVHGRPLHSTSSPQVRS